MENKSDPNEYPSGDNQDMPKILLNPYRNNLSLAGITLRHDAWLNQPVRTDSDVAFNTLTVGNLTASGNIVFSGNVTEVETEHLLIKDNIIDINSGNEVPLMTGGLSIQRGPGLQSYDILWNENERLLKIGLGPNAMSAVATREDAPVDKWLAVWNQGTARFDTTDQLNIPLTFGNRLTLGDVLAFGPDSAPVTAPPLLYRRGNDLVVETPSGNTVFPSISGRESAVILPFNRRLDFEQSYFKADALGTGVIVKAETLTFATDATGRIAWPPVTPAAASASIFAEDGTVFVEGSDVNLQATNSVLIDAPQIVHGVATFSTLPGGVYRFETEVDFQFVTGTGTGTVDVPKLSLNGKKAWIITDDNGNTSMNATGDLFLNPATTVYINSGKALAFAGTGVRMFVTGADFTVGNGSGAIKLAATGKVLIPTGVSLDVGSGCSLYEDLDTLSTVLASVTGNITLSPGSGKVVQIAAGVALNFADQPVYGTSAGDIVASPTGSLLLAAGLAVRIPMGTPFLFGDNSSATRVYKDAQGMLNIENDRSIKVSAADGLVLPDSIGLRLGSSASRLFQDVDGSMTFAAGSTGLVKSSTPFLAASTNVATGTGIPGASLTTLGGMYVAKNMIVKQSSTLQGPVTIGENIQLDGSGVIPVKITNASATNGVAVSMSSQWDTTAGYTIGRGSPTQGGGRAMVFTIPSYAYYGITPRPAFVFASSRGDSYMELSDTACTLSETVALNLLNTSDTALSVSGKSTLASLNVIKNMQVAGDTFTVDPGNGTPGEGLVTVNGQVNLLNGYGALIVSAADPLADPLFTLNAEVLKIDIPMTVYSSLRSMSSVDFAGNVTVSGGVLNMASGRVTNLALPVSELDACNRLYVDSVARGNTAKQAVSAATTGPIDLSTSIGTVDDVSLDVGDRVLVFQQSDSIQNGIYQVATSGLLTRSADLAEGQTATGSSVFVTGGTQNGTTGFVVVGSSTLVGTDPLTWTPFSGASMIQAGRGIVKTGNTFSVSMDGVSIGTDSSGNVKVLDTYFAQGITITNGHAATSTDQSHINKVGTITAGEWRGTPVAVAYGGTGVTSFQEHSLLTGNGSGAIQAHNELYYSQGQFGVGTRSPQAQLHVMGPATGVSTGTFLRIQDGATGGVVAESGLVVVTSGANTARITQKGDGTLYIGQEDITSAGGKIQFSTKQISRMVVDANGNVVVGGTAASNTPISGCLLSVLNGSIGSTGNLTLGGRILFTSSGAATSISADAAENGTLRLTSPVVSVLGTLRLEQGAGFSMQGFQVLTGVNGGTDIYSSGSSGVQAPLRFKTGLPNASVSAVASATVLTDGFLVPKLQIGGNENDRSLGFTIQTEANGVLSVAPGTLGRNVAFKGPVQMANSLLFVAGSDTSKAVNMFLDGKTLYIQPPFSAASSTYDGHSVVFGGGSQNIITTFANNDISDYVRYDPVSSTSTHPGGVFSVSRGVLTTFAGAVQFADSLQFAVGNAAEGVLSAIGWYYLGPLGAGKTIVGVPGGWTLRLDYDGRNPYTSTLFAFETTNRAAVLVIYVTQAGQYEVFIRTVSAPCRFSVYQSPTIFHLSQYEGGGATPSGEFSNYVSADYRLDYDLGSAQANGSMECGSLDVLGTARMNNATLTGSTTMTGEFNLTGQARVTGGRHVFQDPYTTLPGVTIAHESNQGSSALFNSVTIHGAAAVGSVPSFCLSKGTATQTNGPQALALSTASVSLIPENDTNGHAGAVNFSHNLLDSSSKVMISTRMKPRLIVDQTGSLSVLNADNDDDNNNFTVFSATTASPVNATLNVTGKAYFDKRVVSRGIIATPELHLGSAVRTASLAGDVDGNIVISQSSGQPARLRGLAPPIDADDAATRAFVETMIQGLSPKDSVAAATTGPIDLSTVLTTLDGVLLSPGQRVLVKDNATLIDNGIYVVQYAAPPIRSDDMALNENASAAFVFVSSGDVNASSGWVCAAPVGHATIGVNDLVFTQFSGAGHITAGLGLSKTGNQLQVLCDGSSIETGANKALRISANAAGMGLSGGSGLPLTVSSVTHLDTLGTIRAGIWNGSAVGMSWGGTGATNFAAGRIPYSNGLSLTQGKLFFDDVNVRLGVNTTTPTSGLTVEDRDVQITSTTALSASQSGAVSPAASSALMFTAIAANETFALRNTGASFIISAGTGTNKLTLSDILTLDPTGSLFVKREVFTRAINVGPADTTTVRWDADGITRTASGPLVYNMYSSDNTGASISFYGGLGVPNDHTNSESMRMGFYNGRYVVATTATGTGTARNLLLQAAGNVDQLLVKGDGSVSMSGPLLLSSSAQSSSDTQGGALTVLGGGSFAGTLRTRSLQVSGPSTGGPVTSVDIDGNVNVTGALAINAQSGPVSQAPTTTSFAVSCDSISGVYSIKSNSAEAIASISSSAANNGGNVALHVFGLGRDSSESTEGVLLGYDTTNQQYELRTFCTAAGRSRSLFLSASGAARDQIRLGSDGSVSFRASVYNQGTLTISDQHDATSSLGYAALNVAGGVAVAKSLYTGVAIETPIARVTSAAQFSNAGGLDTVSLGYSASGSINFFDHSALSVNIHTGASEGPMAAIASQEKITLGHSSVDSPLAHVILSTRPQLVMSSGTVPRILTLDDGTSSTSSTTSSITGPGATVAGYLQCKTSVVQTDAIVQGNMSVAGSQSIGSSGNAIGQILSLRGAGNELKFVSNGAQEVSLQTTNTLSVSRPSDGNVFFAINTSGSGVTTVQCPLTIRSAAGFAFQIQNASGNRMFSFDSVDHLLDLAGGRVINSAPPQLAGDLCNKSYVDNLVKGLNLKAAVTAAADSNVDLLRPIIVIDNVTLTPEARVLLMGQTNPVENGIYTVVQGNYLHRANDFANDSKVAGAFSFVQQGLYKGDKGYVCIADAPNDVVGTDSLRFSQFNGNMISAGAGLYKDGNNVMNIALATTGGPGLSFDAGGLRVDPSIAGIGLTMDTLNGVINMEPITELADVTVGRYMATVIDVPFGGTGNNGFAVDSIIYSNGSKLVSDPASLSWNAQNRVLGLNGPANPNNLSNLKDGLTMYDRDIFMLGTETSLVMGSSVDNSYNWRMRKQEAPRLGNVRDIPNGAWIATVFSGQGNVGIVQGEPGSPTYLTTDSGYQWDVVDVLSQGEAISWGETSMSEDGSVILCVGLQDYLYVSHNSGLTFTRVLDDLRRGWEWTSMSNNGQYMLVSSIGTGVFASRDAGMTWQFIDDTDDNIIGFVHVVKSGAIQFIGYWGGSLLVSRDYGATFTEDATLPQCQWWDLVEAKNSGTLLLFSCPGFLYVSEDSGLTWQAKFTDQARDWNSAAISANGNVMAGTIENGTAAYVSTDHGASFSSIFTSQAQLAWMFIQVTQDGTGVFAGGKNFPISGVDLTKPTGIPTDPYEHIPVSSGVPVNSQAAYLTSENYLFYTNDGGRVHRYNYSSPSSNLIFSGGQSNVKSALTDTLIMTTRGFVGIGYTEEKSADISSNLDVNGTMQVSGPLQLDTPLSTTSGGTGANDLLYGLVIAGGHSTPFSSTGLLPENGVPIGNADGSVAIVSGAALRARLGVSTGSQIQAYSANLDAISAMTPSNGTFIVGTGSAFAATSVSQVSNILGLGTLSHLNTIDNSNWTPSGAPLSVSHGGTGAITFTTAAFPWFDGNKLTGGCLRNESNSTITGIRADGRLTLSNSVNNTSGDSNLALLGNSSIVLGTETGATSSAGGSTSYGWALGRDLVNNEFVITGTTLAAGSLQTSDLVERLRISLDGTVSVARITCGAGLDVDAGPVTIADHVTAGSLEVTGQINAHSSVSVSGFLSITGSTTLADSLQVTGAVQLSSQLTTFGNIVIERDSQVGSLATGITVASDQGGLYAAENPISDSMRHISLISNASNASTILSMRNIADSAGRGWDIVVDGNVANGNKIIFQSSPVDVNDTSAPLPCLTLDAISGALNVSGPAAFASTLTCAGDLSTKGNIASQGSTLTLIPRNATATAAVSLTVSGSTAKLSLNPAGAASVENSGGSTSVRSKGGRGVTVAQDTGDVTTDGKLNVLSTVDALSYNNGGALTVSGGAAVAGSMFVQGNVTVSGVITGLNAVKNAVLSTPTADTVNVSQITVKSSRLITVSGQILLTATFKVTPTAGSSNTVFTFALPNRTTTFVERLDLDTAQCSGFSDDVNLTVLQNILCTGIANTTKAVVQFQSVDTTVHYLQVFVSYQAI